MGRLKISRKINRKLRKISDRGKERQKVIGVIPARWGSQRFEGKVLADILGKPMIQHVWERLQQCQNLDEVMIACDDERIKKTAEAFGAKAIMTSPHHPSGTDRIAEAVKDWRGDIVINIQGDEPLIAPQVVDRLAKVLLNDQSSMMATVIKSINDPQEVNDPQVVKVVVDQNQDALYFSRSPIPYHRDNGSQQLPAYYKHLGIYAYRKDFLMKFSSLPKSRLENLERLEQLRVLEAGYKIRTLLTKTETIGVDTPADLQRVIDLLSRRTLHG